MNSFWNGFAKVAVKIALWAAEHPQIVQGILDAATKK